ncbi:hypothetical protein Taro_003714 [Colocasia esculenta]|uniref:Uncharacterized protein n=1 Tax=Colocasia esculenta TaxID=4460 RepID=A0A843TPN8_COLES|nr:hypothetical protein [Colocasia esculenta]
METPVAEENVEVADSVGSSENPLPTSSVASVLRKVLVSIHSSQVVQNTGGSLVDQSVAPGHVEDSVLIDAPIQGEQDIEKEVASQEAPTEDAPVNAGHNEVPIEASLSNDIFQSNVAMKWFNKELSSMKMMLSEVLKAVGPKDSTPQENEPLGPSEDNARPSRQIGVDLVEMSSGPSVDAQAGPSGPSIEDQPSETLPTEDSILCQGSGPEKESLNPVEPGHIKADVLAPILSECERLSPEEWTKLYPLSAQQLGDLNASQASSNQPPLSPGEFLDANYLHLIRDSYLTWVERYKVLFALKKELRSLQIAYPLKIEAFLRFARFGASLPYKVALGNTKIFLEVFTRVGFYLIYFLEGLEHCVDTSVSSTEASAKVPISLLNLCAAWVQGGGGLKLRRRRGINGYINFNCHMRLILIHWRLVLMHLRLILLSWRLILLHWRLILLNHRGLYCSWPSPNLIIHNPKAHKLLNMLKAINKLRTSGKAAFNSLSSKSTALGFRMIFPSRSGLEGVASEDDEDECSETSGEVSRIFLLGYANPLPQPEDEVLPLLADDGDAEEGPGCSAGSWRLLVLLSKGGALSAGMGLAVALDFAPRRGACLGAMGARWSRIGEDGE